MPKVTIWIREEDYDKWKSLEGFRAEWLHQALNGIPDKPTLLLNPSVTEALKESIPLSQNLGKKLRDNLLNEPTVTEPEETA